MADTPRNRRLKNDFRTLERLQAESSIFSFTPYGNPPERYAIEFNGRGLWRQEGSQFVELRDTHSVLIQLGSSYPRMLPDLSWRTPIFHPNISASGHVCLGGYGTHWVPSITLDELCHMLWDMIRYANYDINSPYNREAAQWVRSQRDFYFPVDNRPLRDLVATGQVACETSPRITVEELLPRVAVNNVPAVPAPRPRQAPPPVPAPPPTEVCFLGEVVEASAPAIPVNTQPEDEILFLN
mgnify:CR=1 FL=1